MALIVVASLGIIHAVVTTAIFLGRAHDAHDHPPDELVTLARLIDATPAAERARLMEYAGAALPQLAPRLAAADWRRTRRPRATGSCGRSSVTSGRDSR